MKGNDWDKRWIRVRAFFFYHPCTLLFKHELLQKCSTSCYSKLLILISRALHPVLKTEFRNFKIFCIQLDILPMTSIFRPYKLVQVIKVNILRICFRRYGKKEQHQRILRAKACKENMLHSKGYLPLQQSWWSVFGQEYVPYLSLVFEEKDLKSEVQYFPFSIRGLILHCLI